MSTPSGLDVRGLTVRYGGVVAVDDVDLAAPGGQITGLIGPNGAGKSSIFGACSGLVRTASGRVALDGIDISRLPTHRRCQRGLGRTFQRLDLFESLTVADNVRMGCEGLLAGSRPWAHLFGRRREEHVIGEAVAEAAALCGVEDLLGRPVSILSVGQRRLVELARAAAGGASVLLLDEPSSGLDPAETERFGDALIELVDRRGVGILLVEHDMDLVMRVCSHVHVLDFGRLIFAGDPSAVQADPGVRAAYLGSAA